MAPDDHKTASSGPKNKAEAVEAQKVAQKQRLAKALRENLKRRKAQVRGRAQSGPTESGAADGSAQES